MALRALTVTAGTALVLAAPAAAARPKPITGSVKAGYTVMALADNGRATAVPAKPSFKLAPPASKVTLHLRDRTGKYAGPVVVGGKGSKAIVGVRAGAALGKLVVKRGYAVPRKRLAARAINAKRTARARRGIPLGAGKSGLVAGTARGANGSGLDADRDGVPSAFDADDDGDLVLDNVDRSASTARASAGAALPVHATATSAPAPFWVINAGLEVSYISDDRGLSRGAAGYALNQNAAGPFANDADFERLRDGVMRERGELFFRIDPADPSELDCGSAQSGLSYCRPGGSGFFHTRDRPFPGAFDPDRDGFGAMDPARVFAEGQNGLGTMQTFDPNAVFGLAPLAGAAQIGSGQAFLQDFASGRSQTLSLNTVFGSVPALAAWNDGSHPQSQVVAYPIPRGGTGSESNPIELERSAGGDYVATLSVWRPQRRPIAGSSEPPGWIDIGGLTYKVVGKTVEQSRRLWSCPPDAYSTAGAPAVLGDGGIIDSAPAAPVNSANTLTFSVNLSACMRASGLGEWSSSDPPSDLFVTALSPAGDAAEGGGFAFRPKGPGPSSDQFRGTWRFVGGAPGSEIEWTVTANGAETSDLGIVAYSPRSVTGGTPPPGWTCVVDQAGSNNRYHCTGSTLHSGESVTGRVTLNQAGQDNMSLDLVVCDASNQCKGFGMTQQK